MKAQVRKDETGLPLLLLDENFVSNGLVTKSPASRSTKFQSVCNQRKAIFGVFVGLLNRYVFFFITF